MGLSHKTYSEKGVCSYLQALRLPFNVFMIQLLVLCCSYFQAHRAEIGETGSFGCIDDNTWTSYAGAMKQGRRTGRESRRAQIEVRNLSTLQERRGSPFFVCELMHQERATEQKTEETNVYPLPSNQMGLL